MRKHKLLTKVIERKLPKLYSTEDVATEDKRVVVKFFDPYGNWTWYAVEGERTEDGDVRFFGLVDGHYKEWGYFLLSEVEAVRDPYNPRQHRIERDVHFGTPKISEVM